MGKPFSTHSLVGSGGYGQTASTKRHCKGCGIRFVPSCPQHRYCQPSCYHEFYRSKFKGRGDRVKGPASQSIATMLRRYHWDNPMKSRGWFMRPPSNGNGIECPHCGRRHSREEQIAECEEIERRREIVDQMKLNLRRGETVKA